MHHPWPDARVHLDYTGHRDKDLHGILAVADFLVAVAIFDWAKAKKEQAENRI